MQHKFYSNFKIGLLFGGLVYALTIIFLAGKDILFGQPINEIVSIFIFTFISGIFVVPLLTWIIIRIFPVYVLKEGLRSYNIYCFYKTIQWNEIQTIRPISIIGFKYIRVKSKSGGPPIWIPIWINNKKDFLDNIDNFGGNKSFFQKYFDKGYS